jgi:hypothetical protein
MAVQDADQHLPGPQIVHEGEGRERERDAERPNLTRSLLSVRESNMCCLLRERRTAAGGSGGDLDRLFVRLTAKRDSPPCRSKTVKTKYERSEFDSKKQQFDSE